MISEDQIKDSFSRVKEDIDFLKKEAEFLREEVSKTRENMSEIVSVIKELSEKFINFNEKVTSTHRQENQTAPTHPSTHNFLFKPLNSQNLAISTGNRGVPTDRQTDRQTDQHMEKQLKKEENSMKNALEILNSLDKIKKEIRLKFKRLTDQEMLVFSTLYQVEEEDGFADYKAVSQRLNLSESSIRDYVGRLIKKDIPIDKKKVNNKTIHLHISENLKKIAPLHTILQLRSL